MAAKHKKRGSWVSPRVPDWLGIAGDHLVFVLDDRVFFRSPTGAMADVGLDDEPAAFAVGPHGVGLVVGDTMLRFLPDGTAVDSTDLADLEGIRVLPGWDAVLRVGAPAHRLFASSPLGELPLPEGATRARFAAPFAAGSGLCWIDMEQLYRLPTGGIPNVLGRAPKAEAMAVGPGGAVVVQLEKDSLVAPIRGVAAKLGCVVDASSVRFSPDGTLALASDEGGVTLIDLRAASESHRWDGDILPVGFGPHPVVLDGATGALVGKDGEPTVKHFCPPLDEAT